MANITNNNFNDIEFMVSKSDYFDFVISKENDPSIIYDGSEFYDDNLISFIDIDDTNCVVGDKLYSSNNYKYNNAINSGVTLNNIGLTGIDNGLINFNKFNITSTEFQDILTGSSINILSGDTRLMLKLVSGNTGEFVYPTEYVHDLTNSYISLNGGFYQGFFKAGENYSILPDKIESELCFDIIIKPTNHGISLINTLNYKYPENKGIFLYLGTRSENKFWYEYLKDDTEQYTIVKTGQTTPLSNNIDITTHDGFNTKSQNIYDISTDNKYLLFNQTSNGYRVNSFNEDDEYHITGQDNENVNLYLSVNKTPTGYNTSTYNSIPNINKPYKLINDITGNAIGFRVDENGRIGYRMINNSCENESGFIIDEEYSEPNILINDKLAYITIRLSMNTDNTYNTEDRQFKILIYVDSKLVLTSKYLPELHFRKLDDIEEKQEGVGFNISVGGGSQGLLEMFGFNNNYSTRYLLPIEKYFAGSFIGNLYKLRIYNGRMDYTKIKNNYIYCNEYTPVHIDPIVEFFINAFNLITPETNYKREVGNTSSILNANITLSEEHFPITGYKIYYYLNNDNNKTQINGLFTVDQLNNNTIKYDHNDLTLQTSGITSIKYELEIFDNYNIYNGVKSNKTITFDYMIFYGSTNAIPSNSDDIRKLNKSFNSDSTFIELNTGTVNKTFVIAIPSTREILNNQDVVGVIDTNAYNVDITDAFIKREMYIKDFAGVDVLYNVYVMTNAIPYSKNHKLLITLN